MCPGTGENTGEELVTWNQSFQPVAPKPLVWCEEANAKKNCTCFHKLELEVKQKWMCNKCLAPILLVSDSSSLFSRLGFYWDSKRCQTLWILTILKWIVSTLQSNEHIAKYDPCMKQSVMPPRSFSSLCVEWDLSIGSWSGNHFWCFLLQWKKI